MGDSLEETETEYYLKMCYTSRNGDVGKYKYIGTYNTIEDAKIYLEICKNDMMYPPEYNTIYIEDKDGEIDYCYDFEYYYTDDEDSEDSCDESED